jgi:5-dehydro-2-deoxygluconokinase
MTAARTQPKANLEATRDSATSNRLDMFDLITVGRSSIDLYSNDIGAALPDVRSFGAYIGGSPLNIAVGSRRLGLKTALLTAVGADKIGEFILERLRREGVETHFISVKPGARSSAVVLGIEPPDRFPITMYRENAADIQLGIDDVLTIPMQHTRALEVSGTAFSKEPSRSAAMYAIELARAAGVTVYVDLDFRADQWHDPRAFGVNIRAMLPMVDVAMGTEEEINAAMLRRPEDIVIHHSQITAPEIRGDVNANTAALLERLPEHGALVVKTGARGSRVHTKLEVHEVPGFPVEVLSVLGAGDAFAAGLIYGRAQSWDWFKSARMGNACGAIVVTRIGCADFTPTLEETLEFIAAHGGF